MGQNERGFMGLRADLSDHDRGLAIGELANWLLRNSSLMDFDNASFADALQIAKELASASSATIARIDAASEQPANCEGCGRRDIAAVRAVWTEDGSSFCPTCAPPSVSPTPVNAMPPEEAASRIREIAGSRDPESGHVEADGLLVEILRRAGYGEAAQIFDDMMKWYG